MKVLFFFPLLDKRNQKWGGKIDNDIGKSGETQRLTFITSNIVYRRESTWSHNTTISFPTKQTTKEKQKAHILFGDGLFAKSIWLLWPHGL